MKASINPTTATTTTLIAAPGEGSRLKIHRIMASAVAAQQLSIYHTSDASGNRFMYADVAAGQPVEEVYLLPGGFDNEGLVPENTAVSVVTGQATSTRVKVIYSVIDV